MRAIVTGRRISLMELRQLALNCKTNLWAQARELRRDVKLYLHWTAGHYGQFYDEYHINIDADGGVYTVTDDLSVVLSHTYRRNTGAIGITLACGASSTSSDLGEVAPTEEQIESMARVISVLAKALDLTIDLKRVMTHGEAADNEDGLNPNYEANGYPEGMYGPKHSVERWDLAILHNDDPWCSGGNILRGKANWYCGQYPDGVEHHFTI